MKRIYVDLDGTLLDSSLDVKFNYLMNRYGKDVAMEWYNSVYVDDLELNLVLWLRLVILKEEGNELIVWTNRGQNQVDMTMSNLAKLGIIDMFSGFMFFNGKKNNFPLPEGIVFENEFRNEVPCHEFVYIPTFEV